MRIRIETLEKDCNIKPFQAFSYTTLNGICYSRKRVILEKVWWEWTKVQYLGNVI